MVSVRLAETTDFDNIYALYNKESDLVGPVMPLSIRERISERECVVAEEDGVFVGVCNYHLLKREEKLTVYEIAVCREARGKGVAKTIINYLLDTYKRPITAKCITGSPSEKFWSSIGTFLKHDAGRKQMLSIYVVGQEKQMRKGLLDRLV